MLGLAKLQLCCLELVKPGALAEPYLRTSWSSPGLAEHTQGLSNYYYFHKMPF